MQACSIVVLYAPLCKLTENTLWSARKGRQHKHIVTLKSFMLVMKHLIIYGLFNDAAVAQTMPHRIVGWLLTNTPKRMWMESLRVQFEVPSQNVSAERE